jgi:isoleucyl-tRNA synthetase
MARREAGLDVSDRIRLAVDAPQDVIEAAKLHEGFVVGETLAVEVSYGVVRDGFEGKVGEGVPVSVGVAKV